MNRTFFLFEDYSLCAVYSVTASRSLMCEFGGRINFSFSADVNTILSRTDRLLNTCEKSND